ncbi:MAG: hypothetical protein P1Q69_16410 [Candidatus Thorarchaeota archaeon]|nr:hypothetical protein [Candidatus Thorarchaeota archaeon]
MIRLSESGGYVGKYSLSDIVSTDEGQIEVHENGFYLLEGSTVTSRKFSGDTKWSINDVHHIAVSEFGDLITETDVTYAYPKRTELVLSKYNYHGNITWSTNYTLTYNMKHNATFDVMDIACLPNGNTVVILHPNTYSSDPRILEFSSRGILLYDMTIGTPAWDDIYTYDICTAVSNSSRLYVAFTRNDDFNLFVYQLGVFSEPQYMGVIYIIPTLVSASIVAIVLLLYTSKIRNKG